MRHYNIAVMPGDGIGSEVMTEGIAALQAVAELDGGLKFKTQDYDWGTERYLRQGAMMPPDALEVLEAGAFNAILVGPVGDPRVADHITLWGMLLPIRQGFDQYINLRPVRLLEGVPSPLAGKGPKDIDILCVRENCEGEYCGVGGRVYKGTPQESAVQASVFTYHGTERVMRYAFEYARQHGRKKVTSATKSNAVNYSMVFWDDIFRQVSAKYPDIQHEQQLIDSLCARFVNQTGEPGRGRGFKPVRRHRHRSRRGHRRQHGAGSQRQPQSRGPLPKPVPGDPRLGARHRGQRHLQSYRHDLVGLDDAGSPWRSPSLAQSC